MLSLREQSTVRAEVRRVYFPVSPTPFQHTLSGKKALRYKLEQQLATPHVKLPAHCCETQDS